MAYLLMAIVVVAYVVMAYIVMAYIGMACIVVAYAEMACIVMAYIRARKYVQVVGFFTFFFTSNWCIHLEDVP